METNGPIHTGMRGGEIMRTERQNVHVFLLLTAIAIPLLGGGFSAYLTAEDMYIYETMDRPPLAPPGWLFPVAWTILYVVMGIASYLVYVSDADTERKRKAMRVYTAQLIMNLFWSTLFFTYRKYLLAFIWLLVMWMLVLVCTVRFYRIRHDAGLMMGALLVWTTFAAYLNLASCVISLAL